MDGSVKDLSQYRVVAMEDAKLQIEKAEEIISFVEKYLLSK